MELLKPETVAQNLFTTAGTLSKWRLLGVGPRWVKVGPRAVMYSKAELEKWLEANTRSSTSGGGKGGRKKCEVSQEVEK